MIRLLKILELLLYVAACGFAGYRAASEIYIAKTETQPTTFTAADFAERHRNEQWVRVRGRVAAEYRHVQPSPFVPHRGKGLAYVTVPIVAEDWKPEQTVDVLATFGPISMFSAESWAKGIPVVPQTVEGQLRPGGFRDPQGMFPQLSISPSCVTINEGTEPNHGVAMIGFLVLMAVSVGLFLKRLRALLKTG